jgi:hypothetical protein
MFVHWVLCSLGWLLADVSPHRICHIFQGHNVLVLASFLGHVMKTFGEQGYKISLHSFLTWALEGGEVSTLPSAGEPPLPIKFEAGWFPSVGLDV